VSVAGELHQGLVGIVGGHLVEFGEDERSGLNVLRRELFANR
jgi:hypothetical protein